MNTVRKGALEYLTASHIAVPHCFTTRHGGVSQGHLSSLNLGMNRGDDPENVRKNYEILANALGIDLQSLVLARQTHSDTVRRVTRADARGLDHRDYPACDALITDEPGTALAVFTADCTPILLHDPVTGAVGAVHAGWRGTAADIAGKTVKAMQTAFGCRPENLRAAIGPNIGQCCFVTDMDVPLAMIEAFGKGIYQQTKRIRPVGQKTYVNLKEINAYALRRAGVAQIEISTDCTMCQPHRFWSHRFTGGQRGSQGAVILCKEG